MSEKEILAFSDLIQQVFITLPLGTTNRFLMERIFHETKSYPNSIIEVNDPETTLTSVVLGMGVCFLPRSVALSQKAQKSRFNFLAGDYVIREFSDHPAARTLYVTYRKNMTLTREDQIYLDLVRNIAAFIQQHSRYPDHTEYDIL